MFGINWKILNLGSSYLYGKQRFDTFLDFSSKQEAKEFAQVEINNIFCSSCGGKRLRAKGIEVYVRKIYFYKQEMKESMFGKKKHVDIIDKVKWRIEGSGFNSDGEKFIKCRSCRQISYDFPTLKFLSIPISSADNILSLIENMSKSERIKFVDSELIKESVQRPVKMKKLLYLCKEKINGSNEENAHEEARKYTEILNDLGALASAVLDIDELNKF